MSDSTSSASSGGVGFCGLLTVLFIGLKLTGHLTWGWVWILSPLWLGFALAISFVLLFLVGAAVISFLANR